MKLDERTRRKMAATLIAMIVVWGGLTFACVSLLGGMAETARAAGQLAKCR